MKTFWDCIGARVRTPLAFVLLALYAFAGIGCVSSHYDGDALGEDRQISGFASDEGDVAVYAWNFDQNRWRYLRNVQTESSSFLWYKSNDLYAWDYHVPDSVLGSASLVRDGVMRFRFEQGGVPLRINERSLNTARPDAPRPTDCVVAHLGDDEFVAGTDYYWTDGRSPFHIDTPHVFLDCGASSLTTLELRVD